jgi:predicted O-methyltransferase YrrM
MPRRAMLSFAEFEEEYYRRQVIERYGKPLGLPTVDLCELFPRFDETVEPYSWLEGGSLAIDLAVLKALARRYEDCHYLEIGAWRGESAANVASVASTCYSVSLSDVQMQEAGFGDAFIATARVFSKSLSNVTHIGHDSRTFDFSKLPRMDLVFIDGDHSYGGVLCDTRSAFDLIRNDSSVIVWHDYIRSPERGIHWDVLAGILDGCPLDKRSNLYHLSNTLCAAYIEGSYSTSPLEFPQLPTKSFAVKVSIAKHPACRR